MATSSILLLCILVTCSVWTVQSRNVKVSTDDDQVELSMEAGRIPGVCWACKRSLNKTKRMIGESSIDEVKSNLRMVCDDIWGRRLVTLPIKYGCIKFVNKHLGKLFEKLAATDDVRDICVEIKACKKKELEELFHSGFAPEMEMNEYA